jgi:sugar/nucleoside kinase (ribokinase family)
MGGNGVHGSPEVGEDFILPAFDVAVIDAIGCGDSFIAGLRHGWDL